MNVRPFAQYVGFAAIFSAFAASPALADDPAVKLDDARAKYESRVEDIRTQIDGVFADRLKSISDRPGNNDDAIDKLAAQRDAFKATGTIPSGLNVAAQQREYQKERDKLAAAYDAAADDYNKASLYDLRKTTRAEAKAVGDEEDLRPWSANLLQKPVMLDAATPTWSASNPTPDPYRIEVVGKVDPGSKAVVQVPTPGGKPAAFVAKPDAAGTFRVLLTVRPEAANIDLGVDRQDGRVAAVADVSFPTVHVDGQKLVLEKIRIKPVGKKEVVARLAAPKVDDQRDNDKEGDKPALIRIRRGMTLTGTLDARGGGVMNQSVTATILRADDKGFTVETSHPEGAIWQWDFEIVGEAITLKPNGFRRIRANATLKAVSPATGITASGTLLPDGVHFQFVWPQTPVDFTGSITLKPHGAK